MSQPKTHVKIAAFQLIYCNLGYTVIALNFSDLQKLIRNRE